MENHEINDSRWVDERMASLEPGTDWQPNAGRALARLRSRDRAARFWRRGFVGALAAAVLVCAVLVVMQSPQACATPLGCTSKGLRTVFQPKVAAPAPVNPPALQTPAPPAEVPVKVPGKQALPQRRWATAGVESFRETGSFRAPVTCEVYSDYECPACAQFYLETVPRLMAEYVRTGKVKLVHRDYPLVQHAFSRLAARYANAAGRLGHYDAVVEQLFKTQAIWGQNGNVDAQVARVLPEDLLDQVRRLVNGDAHLDDSVNADMAAAAEDNLTHTPTVVVVANRHRQTLPGAPSYEELKSYLDQALAGK
jgi:protein-disulfide isomerase